MSKHADDYSDAVFIMAIERYEDRDEEVVRCLHISSTVDTALDWLLDADLVGRFEEKLAEDPHLVSIEFTIWDANNQDIYPYPEHPSWDRERDAVLFNAMWLVKDPNGDVLTTESLATSNDYDEVRHAYDACDIEAVWNRFGGYGAGVTVEALLMDESPTVFGGGAEIVWSRTFDDSAYAERLNEIGEAVREGMLERGEIKAAFDASDADIDMAEAIYSRKSGFIKKAFAEAPGMDAPYKRNADARALSATQGTEQRRDVRVRR